MRRLPLGLVCVLLCALSSCLDPKETAREEGATETSDLTLAEYCTAIADASYSFKVRCFGSAQYPEEARARAIATSAQNCASVSHEIARRRIRFVPSKALACLRAVEARPDCDDPEILLDASCREVLAPVRRLGEPCLGPISTDANPFGVDNVQDCAEGYCERSDSSCAGRCRPKTTDAPDCAWGDACAPGYGCDTYSHTYCTERVGLGSSCFVNPCAEGLRCSSAGGGSPDPVGDTLCVLPGEPCGDQRCGEWEWCSDGACQPASQVGDPCGGNVKCVPGAHCADGEDGLPVCSSGQANGASCQLGSQCASGYCAFSSSGFVCAPRGPEGAPCDPSFVSAEDDEACAPGLLCALQDRTCQPLASSLQAGAPCRRSSECVSNLCDGSTCAEVCHEFR